MAPRLCRCCLTIASLVPPGAVVAQPAAPPAFVQAAPAQTFRTGTLLVEVDAIVTDGKGQFVADLSARDFEIHDEGKAQTIERMYLVRDRVVTPLEAAAGVNAPASLPPTLTRAQQRVYVLVFDGAHLQEGALRRLKDAAIGFLTKEFQAGDVGGIVIGNVMAGNQLTSDREALLEAIRSAKPSAAKTSRRLAMYEWPRLNSEGEAIRIALANDRELLDQAVRRACNDDPDACRRIDPEPSVMEKARQIVNDLRPAANQTTATLRALVSGLARVPGRKTVVLLSEGFFVEESWGNLRQIVGEAARANVRIYGVDARGLNTRDPADVRFGSSLDPGGSIPVQAYDTIEDGPNTLALDTGGRMFRRTNDFASALAQIARDTSNYYVIGYSPTEPATDGSLRRIAVRVKRPGVTVRARRSYVAAPLTAPATSPTNPAEGAAAAGETGGASEAIVGDKAEVTSGASLAVGAKAAGETGATGTGKPGTSAGAAVTFRPDAVARVDALASANASGPRDGRDLASRGWDRYQKGDLEGAADLLGRASRDPGAPPWVHYALGYSELGLRRPEQAALAWERVRAEVPQFRTVYLDLAGAYVQAQNFGRALEVLKVADGKWPEDPEFLNAIGTIQVRRGALDDALKTFRATTSARPDDAVGYLNLARTYELRYFKMRRYLKNESRWVANADDLQHAVAAYEEYVKRGGPYADEARRALEKLRWLK